MPSTSGQFRKKPVIISAWLIDHPAPKPDRVAAAFATEVIDWCPSGEGLYINTLEACMKGGMGDWLIRGVKGELYACQPEIFAATYEPFYWHSKPLPTPTMTTDMIDKDDGENRAVRAFLAYYGASINPTAEKMAWHMRACGFDFVPDWVPQAPGHLTKGGAQLWLRMLFALEAPAGMATVPVKPTDDMLIAGQEAWVCTNAHRPAVEDCEQATAVWAAMVAAAA